MRRMIFVAHCMLMFFNIWAQKQELPIKNQPVCPVSFASKNSKKLFIPPPAQTILKSANNQAVDFQVVFSDFPVEAHNSFYYALSIWKNLLSSEVPVNILAKFEPLEINILAKSRPSMHYKNFENALINNALYPVALAEKLAGRNMNSDEPDIICTFNSNIAWYYGTDGNTPETKYDFVTAALHEIAHGLGISGFLNVKNNTGFFDNNENLPSIYDTYIHNLQNHKLADRDFFESPSEKIFYELTSENLSFYCNTHEHEPSDRVKLFAPSVWKKGSSIYHLEEETSAEPGKLMTPYTARGEAVHNPGSEIMMVLSEMGWKTVSFRFQKIKDFEEPNPEFSLNMNIISDFELDSSSVKLYYTSNYTNLTDSVLLHFDSKTNCFSGTIPLNNVHGRISYYFKANTQQGQTFSCPTNAPENILHFFIGPDFFPPQINHNPTLLMYLNRSELNFNVNATDNLGIRKVQVEYKINGEIQEPFILNESEQHYFQGLLSLKNKITKHCRLEYRLVAFDQSKRINKKTVPTNGYYSVNIFHPADPVNEFITDFDTETNDFVFSGFTVSRTGGFSNANLHTLNPYPVSELINQPTNLVAMLKHPVIFAENGKMTFNEVVLVEPGEPETSYKEMLFWDYVIVEGSKDHGKSWHPLINGYDSGIDPKWKQTFTENSKNKTSLGTANENLFLPREIYLTENNNFLPHDTVLVRFRLSSDNSWNGWGWAIDNLKIQSIQTGEMVTAKNNPVNVYPNPFNSHIFVNFQNNPEKGKVKLEVFNNVGSVAYSKTLQDVSTLNEKIFLDNLPPGFYQLKIYTENKMLLQKTMIKNN